MINLKLTIAYEGTRYNGWQKQGNTSNTIQEKIEETISRIIGEEIEIAGSGRTDSGVHALAQIANFKVKDEKLRGYLEDLNEFRDEINEYLPKDVRILAITKVNERFHARLNAVGKHYSYRIDNGEVADIFERKYLTRIEEPLNLDKMREATELMVGEHDFMSFCANKKMKKSTVRNVTKIDITSDKGIIKIDFYGNGFLYNMIRIMVGTLIEVGLSKRTPKDIERILESKNRAEAGYLAPASGLFLEEVYYECGSI